MTIAYPGYQPRQRPTRSARSRSSDTPERMQEALDHGAEELTQPFVGVTTDGAALPNLYPTRSTGITTRPMADAARTFLSLLSEQQRSNATFPIATDEWRRWHNTHPNFMRHGLVLEGLNDAQRDAVLDLLRASLSAAGFDTARGVMQLNHTVGELTDSWDEYDEWLYWISIMGTPSADEPWGWQFDGHHLNVQCFVLGDQVVMTPTFMARNPSSRTGASMPVFEFSKLRSAPASHWRRRYRLSSLPRRPSTPQRSSAVASPIPPVRSAIAFRRVVAMTICNCRTLAFGLTRSQQASRSYWARWLDRT